MVRLKEISFGNNTLPSTLAFSGQNYVHFIYHSRAHKTRNKPNELRAYIWLRAAIYLVNCLVEKSDFRLIAAGLKCAAMVSCSMEFINFGYSNSLAGQWCTSNTTLKSATSAMQAVRLCVWTKNVTLMPFSCHACTIEKDTGNYLT